jgi:hypothetical protein
MSVGTLGVATGSNAGHRSVPVTGLSLMVGVGTWLVVERLGVAIDAGHVCVVGLIDMAVGTNRSVMRQPPEIIVIEVRAQPARGVVAVCTCRRETRSNVIGHATTQGYRALPRGHVAAVAIFRQIPGIVVIHMACGAGRFARIGVCTG